MPRVLSQTGEKTPDLTLPVETAGARTCGATQARAGPPATLDFHRDALWCGAWDRGTITGSLGLVGCLLGNSLGIFDLGCLRFQKYVNYCRELFAVKLLINCQVGN